MIGLKHLKAFVTLVERKNFTKAAEALYQSQPALSIQIKNLEDSLQAKLVERKDKEIILTDAGKIFYTTAKDILAAYDRAIEDMDELKGLHKGCLCLGAGTLPGEYILPELLKRFKAKYPQIRVDLKIAASGEILEDLKNRKIHIGFVSILSNEHIFEAKLFRKDKLVLILPPNETTEINWDHFPVKRLILREAGSGTRKAVEDYLKKRVGITRVIPGIEIGSTRAIINMVAAGLGISYVSEWAANEAILLGKIKTTSSEEDTISRQLYATTLRGSYMSYAAKAFFDLAMNDVV